MRICFPRSKGERSWKSPRAAEVISRKPCASAAYRPSAKNWLQMRGHVTSSAHLLYHSHTTTMKISLPSKSPSCFRFSAEQALPLPGMGVAVVFALVSELSTVVAGFVWSEREMTTHQILLLFQFTNWINTKSLGGSWKPPIMYFTVQCYPTGGYMTFL